MIHDPEVTVSETKPVVTLKGGVKPKTEMGNGGGDVPFVRLRTGVKPKTEMGDGGCGVSPTVRRHITRD